MFADMLRKNKAVVGFDLGNDYAQISYCRADQSMPDTMSLVMGEEQYNIPTVLSRRHGADEAAAWSIGAEALKDVSEGKGILVEDLVLLAKNNVSVKVEDEDITADVLLAVFIRKTLAILSLYVRTEDIEAIAFTMRDMNSQLMENVKKAAQQAGFNEKRLYFLSHEDCFFQYMIHQPGEMWIHDVLLYDYRSDGMKSYLLQMNRKTNPVACFIESDLFPEMKPVDISKKQEAAKNAFYRQLDAELFEIAKKQCEKHNITSVFLLGDYFSREWCKESLRFLCRERRVFQGNNLFSKGACYGAREKVFPSTLSTSYVYLSDDKLRANIGMTCDRGQEEIYFPILNAGTNWYDAKREFDVMLTKNNTFTLNIAPVDGSKTRLAKISLEGLKVRGNKTNRVGLRFFMEDSQAVQIEITDKGFGEFFPSTGRMWRECLPLEVIS
ncbi:MAG: hypothetical protein K2P35_08700 [Lachnospiraceae bacterium]|jgi:hypothetical protein|nr:hypothetical protein [Lachnospiraceae bacterium]